MIYGYGQTHPKGLFRRGPAGGAAGGLAEGTQDVLLMASSTPHTGLNNTKTALENKGHTVKIEETTTLHSSYDFAPYDLIALLLVDPTDAALTYIEGAMDAGKPCLVGLTGGATSGTGQTGISTELDLTGLVRTASSTEGYTSEEITDNSHEITSVFSLGTVQLFTSGNWCQALDQTSESHIGSALSEITGVNSAMNNKPPLFAAEAGTKDVVGSTLAARTVVWMNLYAGQSTYSADGETLLDRIVRWLAAENETDYNRLEDTEHNSTVGAVGKSGSDYFGQSFLGNGEEVAKLGFYLQEVGGAPEGTVYFGLAPDDGSGNPDVGNILWKSSMVNPDGNVKMYTVDVPNISLTNGVRYHAIIEGLDSDADISGRSNAATTNGSTATGDNMQYSNDAGATWTTYSSPVAVQIYTVTP